MDPETSPNAPNTMPVNTANNAPNTVPATVAASSLPGAAQPNPLASIIPATSSSVQTGTNPLSIVGPVAAAGAPTPPSMESILSESGLPAAQTNLETLMDQYTSLQADMSNADLEIQGNNEGVVQSIVNGQVSAVATRQQMNLNNLSAMIQAANTHVSNLQTLTQLQMSAAGTDYTNAVTATDDAFSKAMSMQTALNSQANINQQNSAAYLNTLSGMISQNGVNWNNISPATKSSINLAELQAGWPIGTIESFAQQKPGSNIISSSQQVSPTGQSFTQFIIQNPDGTISVANTYAPGSPAANYAAGMGYQGGSSTPDSSWIPSGFISGPSTSTAANNNPGAIMTVKDPTTGNSTVPAWASAVDPQATVGTNGQVQFSNPSLGMTAIQTNLQTNYGNMTLSAALQKWTGNSGYGANSSTVANLLSQFNLDPNGKVSDVLNNPTEGPQLLNAIMQGEGSISPGGSGGGTGGNNPAALPGSPQSMPWAVNDQSAPPSGAAGNIPNPQTLKTPNALWQNSISVALGTPLQQTVGGMSSTGAALVYKAQVANKAAALVTASGVDAATLQQEFTANSAAITPMVTYMNSVQRAVTGAADTGNQIIAAFSGSGINPSDSQFANMTLNEISKQLTGGQLFAYNAGIAELGNEYSQVFSRGGQNTVSSHYAASDILSGNIKMSDLSDVLTELQTAGNIVLQTSVNQIQNIAGGGGTDAVAQFMAYIAGVPYTPSAPGSNNSSSTDSSTSSTDYTSELDALSAQYSGQ